MGQVKYKNELQLEKFNTEMNSQKQKREKIKILTFK